VTGGSEHEATRERLAQELLDRLTPVMSGLGLLFLLVVVGERMARPGTPLHIVLAVVGWLLWGTFVAEFAVRLVLAPHRGRFLRRNWWQVVFLALPFLRVLRLMRSLRLLRTGRVLSSTVRSSRSAGRLLSDRLAWLGMVTVIVVVAAGELLYEFDGRTVSFARTLHATALMAISGEPVGAVTPYGQVVELVLALYSVTVFATLAGAFGAFFVDDRRKRGTAPPPAEGSADRPGA
jgi:voltage-gated potassium channel